MISTESKHVYRVDKFNVPATAREEFVNNVRRVHEILRTMPGFVQDLLMEQSSDPGVFNLVTVVEWDSQTSVENAKAKVSEAYARENFNPQEVVTRLGIKADFGNYKQIEG